jgi:pimeloyl-ACP methyl ester carboxylesterase
LDKNIYIFSGLGTDERVFVNIDLNEFHPTFIKWIDPLANETIEAYASRLLVQIKYPNPILIGLSFGGMMAIEVSKQIATEKVIIISSAKTFKEIPLYYRIPGMFNIHRRIPVRKLKKFNFITTWFFGTQSKAESKLLHQITKDTDPNYVKWAVDKIVKWRNKQIPANIYHIHGTKDRILPLSKSQYDKQIEGGGHLMIMNKSTQITEILKQLVA